MSQDILDAPDQDENEQSINLFYGQVFILLFSFFLPPVLGFRIAISAPFAMVLLAYTEFLLTSKNAISKAKSFLILSNTFLATILLLGLLFRINSWPFGSELLTSGLLFLAISYLVLGIFIPAKHPFFYLSKLSFGIGVGAYCSALLFRIQRWPFVYELLQTGFILCTIAFFLFLYLYIRDKENNRTALFFFPTIALVILDFCLSILLF